MPAFCLCWLNILANFHVVACGVWTCRLTFGFAREHMVMPSPKKGARVELWGALIAWISWTSSPATHQGIRNCAYYIPGPGIGREPSENQAKMDAHMVFVTLGIWCLLGHTGAMLREPLTVLVTRKIVDQVTIASVAIRKWCRIGLIISRGGGNCNSCCVGQFYRLKFQWLTWQKNCPKFSAIVIWPIGKAGLIEG